jgi:hypothetical protein
VCNNGKYDADDDADQRHDISNAKKHDFPLAYRGYCASRARVVDQRFAKPPSVNPYSQLRVSEA